MQRGRLLVVVAGLPTATFVVLLKGVRRPWPPAASSLGGSWETLMSGQFAWGANLHGSHLSRSAGRWHGGQDAWKESEDEGKAEACSCYTSFPLALAAARKSLLSGCCLTG